MIRFDRNKDALVVTGTVDIYDILKLDSDYVSFDRRTNRVVIEEDIIIEENATLTLFGTNVELDCDYISLKEEATLLLGTVGKEYTDILFKDCELFAYSNTVIKLNNVNISSRAKWDLTIANEFTINNTTIDFEIKNNSKLTMNINNLTCTGNGDVISLADTVNYYNMTTPTKDKTYLTIKNNNKNVYVYNPTLGNIKDVASNSDLSTNTTVNVIIRGNKDFPNYSLDIKNNRGTVTLKHELLLKGKFITVSGNTINTTHNGTYDIFDSSKDKIGILVIEDGIINQYVPYYLNKKITFPLTIGNNLLTITKAMDLENILYIGLDSNLKPIDNILIERMINNMNVEINNNHRDITNLLHHMVETSGKPIKVTPPITINTCGGSKIII